MKINVFNTISQLEAENSNEQEVIKKLTKRFSVMSPGAIYTGAYKLWKTTKGAQGWNGRVSLINDSSFLTGLLEKVTDELINIHNIKPTLNNKTNIRLVKLGHSDIELRDYQYEALKAALENKLYGAWWPRGVLEMATGAGKSRLAVAIYDMTRIPTLCLVHRKHLVKQMIDNFAEHNIEAGIIADGRFEPNKYGITVATFQTLQQMIWKSEYHSPRTGYRVDDNGKSRRVKLEAHHPSQKDLDNVKKLEPLFNDIEQLFLDESHLLASKVDTANEFIKVSCRFTNAFMRWGLTATPFMKDEYSNLLLEGVTGKSLYKINSKTLIDAEYLTPVKIKVIKHNAKSLMKNLKWPIAYKLGIVENDIRNKTIVQLFEEVPKPCFIMCAQVQQGEILADWTNLPILTGASSLADRTKILDDMAAGYVDGCIVTTIFDEGVDLPELKSIILAGGGKSQIKTLQRIGRVLRLAEGKTEALVYDLYDHHHSLLRKHSNERIVQYREQEFTVERE